MDFEPRLKIPDNILLSVKTLPSAEALQTLQDYNNRMLEELSKKTESLYQHNIKLTENESKLSSLLHVIEEKRKQIEEENELYKSDQKVENYCDSRLKEERHKRLLSLQEYQIKMAELRSIMKSSVLFNDEQVKQEIDEIKNKIETLSKDVDSYSQLYLAKQAENILDPEEKNVLNSLMALTEEFKAIEIQYTTEINDLETELKKIDEEIKNMEQNQ